MALAHQGEFKHFAYQPDFELEKMPRVDSQGMIKLTSVIEFSKEYEILHPEPDDDSEEKMGAWKEKRVRQYEELHENEIKAMYQVICHKIAAIIAEKCDAGVVNTLVNAGSNRNDGVGLFHQLKSTYAGEKSKNFSLLSLYGRFFRMEMKHSGKETKDLEEYNTRFRQHHQLLQDMEQTLPVQLVCAVYISGLKQRYARIRETISDEPKGLLNLQKIIQRVQAHADLLDYQKEKYDDVLPDPRSSKVLKVIADTEKKPAGAGVRVVVCFNCGKKHPGGERQCTRPCKYCGDKNHTRYNCPDKEKHVEAIFSIPTLWEGRQPETLDSLVSVGRIADEGKSIAFFSDAAYEIPPSSS